jgi:hypothetical protein
MPLDWSLEAVSAMVRSTSISASAKMFEKVSASIAKAAAAIKPTRKQPIRTDLEIIFSEILLFFKFSFDMN